MRRCLFSGGKGSVLLFRFCNRSVFFFQFHVGHSVGRGPFRDGPLHPRTPGLRPWTPQDAGRNSRSWERLRAAIFLPPLSPGLPPPSAAPFTLSRCRGSMLPAGFKRYFAKARVRGRFGVWPLGLRQDTEGQGALSFFPCCPSASCQRPAKLPRLNEAI